MYSVSKRLFIHVKVKWGNPHKHGTREAMRWLARRLASTLSLKVPYLKRSGSQSPVR